MDASTLNNIPSKEEVGYCRVFRELVKSIEIY